MHSTRWFYKRVQLQAKEYYARTKSAHSANKHDAGVYRVRRRQLRLLAVLRLQNPAYLHQQLLVRLLLVLAKRGHERVTHRAGRLSGLVRVGRGLAVLAAAPGDLRSVTLVCSPSEEHRKA